MNWLEKLLETTEVKERRLLAEKEKKEEDRRQLKEELINSDEMGELIKKKAQEMVIEAEAAAKRKKEKEKEDHLKIVEKAIEDVKTIGASMQDSNEPFCNVLSMGFDRVKGIRVSLDYNEAFIRYLNAAGIKASNEEETIRLYLAHLNYDINDSRCIYSCQLCSGLAIKTIKTRRGNIQLPPMFFKKSTGFLTIRARMGTAR